MVDGARRPLTPALAAVVLLLAGGGVASAQCIPQGGGPATVMACPTAVNFQPTDWLLGMRAYNGTDVVALPGQTVKISPNSLSQLIAFGGGGGATFGQQFPTTGVAIGGQFGNTLVPVNVDGAGNIKAVLAGQISNATGGVAPSNNNTAAVGWVYGFTGSVWNPLLVSGAGFLETAVSAPLPAGTQIIGQVDIDQTTPGATNAVSLGYVGSTAMASGAGATGAGSPRVTVAQDATTIAGSPPTFHVLVTPDANTPLGISQIAGQPAPVGRGGYVGALRTVNAQDITTLAGSPPGAWGSPTPQVTSVQGGPLMYPVAMTDVTLAKVIAGGSVQTAPLPYPAGAVPLTASTVGTTAATTATLAATAAAKTWVCGFSITSSATAAAVGNATITGTTGGTMNFQQFTQALASGVGINGTTFNPCIPSSATNTAIAVVSATPGSGGNISVTAWGFWL